MRGLLQAGVKTTHPSGKTLHTLSRELAREWEKMGWLEKLCALASSWDTVERHGAPHEDTG